MGDPVAHSLIASGVLDSLVLLGFIFRLWIRIKMQRVGWEDIWATVAFVCGTMNIVSSWIYLIKLSVGQSSMTAMWIYMFTFTCSVWAVRISIIYSIIRIIPPKERLHIYGLMIVTFFFLTCSALIVQKAISCIYAYHVYQSTSSSLPFHCGPINTLSISELAVGSVADITAVVFPLYVLRRVTLPPKHLRLLRLLFSSNIMVAIACCLRAICDVVPVLTRWSVVIANLQMATCLLVCNLLVVATYLYRVLGCQKHRALSDTTEKDTTVEYNLTSPSSVPRQMTLTTIELLFSTHGSERASVTTGGTIY